MVLLGNGPRRREPLRLRKGRQRDENSPGSVTGLRHGNNRGALDVQGLTTAATIWVNAAVGVAVGGGEYRVAIIAVGVALVALVLLGPVERLIDRRRPDPKTGVVVIDAAPSSAAAAAPLLEEKDDLPRSTPR